MFIICRDNSACSRSISRLVSRLEGIPCGPIQTIQLGEYWLGWSRCQAHENLHTFSNGLIIGKLSFTEPPCETPIQHTEPVPTEIHPLATGLSITQTSSSLIIKPFNVTSIYYGKDSVSDMQLLIADAEGHLPSHEGVALLATVGFFPGNLTLFKEVRHIPFLVSYDLPARQLSSIPTLSFPKADDTAMLERLKSIVPNHPRQYLGMTGGYDSRFVLGILRQRGITPNLIHVDSEETEAVLQIAKKLHAPHTLFAATEASYLSPEVYTLATDAQIYFRGGNYSCLRNNLERDSLYYSGHFSNSLIKNSYAQIYKQWNTNIKNAYDRCIPHLFIRHKDGMTYGLREISSLSQLQKYLLDELQYGKAYGSFDTRKAYVNWFHYIVKLVRWCPANFADLSYFTQPVYLLADLEALKLGITSSEWDNYKHDRLRRLNSYLLPELTISYHGDTKGGQVQNGWLNTWGKIEYEYLQPYIKYLKSPRELFIRLSPQKIAPPLPKAIFSFENVSFDAPGFTCYFTTDIENILSGSQYSYWLKRAAVTVGYTLQFLGH